MLLGILCGRSLSPSPNVRAVCNVSPASEFFSSLSLVGVAIRPWSVQRSEEAARSRLINGAGWNFNDSSAHDFSRTRIRMETSFRLDRSTRINEGRFNLLKLFYKIYDLCLIDIKKFYFVNKIFLHNFKL